MHATKSCINVRYYIYLPISFQKHNPLDPTRNIKTKWEIIEWTSDGHAYDKEAGLGEGVGRGGRLACRSSRNKEAGSAVEYLAGCAISSAATSPFDSPSTGLLQATTPRRALVVKLMLLRLLLKKRMIRMSRLE
ncbi:uncharacterized protein LOC119276010 isoform X2 [Triticum dicoccoides]|uniref:uncharacterized protein n=1 Tax=Triticum aestivum TaxID=4565 RepID=UPI00188EEEBA|nr:uncharacterized protein LOC119276010 isoform X2 [Triticum dicoccoides]XP_044348729.1 uncharacterized protein LOC123069846 [Triticum aestivum]